jgi:hypothetical protein
MADIAGSLHSAELVPHNILRTTLNLEGGVPSQVVPVDWAVGRQPEAAVGVQIHVRVQR